ncbi:MAG: prolyl oligopeptidase family serine peptidase [Gemmatimonadaceae bacterium]
MSTPIRVLAALLIIAAGSTIAGAQSIATAPLQYPDTRRSDHTDIYHGISVPDPYRWLEDTDSPETAAWVAAQNEVTFAYLAGIPERGAIRARLTELWDYPKYGTPFREDDRTFYFENSGLQNQSVLYVRDDDSAPRVLIDPNRLSPDGTVALSTVEPSPSGDLLGFGVSTSGSDWQEFHVLDIASTRPLPDTLRWIKFSGMSWTNDNDGFFYSRYAEPTGDNALTSVVRNQKLYYHRLGTPQSEDELIYENPDEPDWGFDAEVTHDGLFAIITVWQGTDERNRLYLIDLASARNPNVDAPIVRLFDDFDATYDFIGNEGTRFYVRTTNDAPLGRVVAFDIMSPRERDWRTIIPEGKDALVSVQHIGGRLVAEYLQDARSSVRIYSMNGAATDEIDLPAMGSVGAINGDPDDEDFFYSFTSYLYPTSVFRYDMEEERSELHRAPEITFDASRYETKQIFYESSDGTRVPMFITMRKGTQLDGNNPTLLYAYGGFNISMTPGFSTANLVWLEMGGIYAVANLRGGGEYGQAWHEAGMFEHKQNVFDDFIAGAEYLIAEEYTSPGKLAMQGGSNGGLLVGAVMTQRPELFGAALPAVGVMDMLRYHEFTIGWAWASEYGTSADSAQFEYLHEYSPLHNIEPGTHYPATLITTADHDDRVVPGHSFKFAATLQAAQAGPDPVLIRIETKAGHGAGKPTTKQIEEAADRFAFLAENLGMSPQLTP